MRPVRADTISVVGALAVVAAAMVWWNQGHRSGPALSTFVLMCALAVATGEAVRATVERHAAAPISLASGLALAVSPVVGPRGFGFTTADVVLVVAVAMLCGSFVGYAAGRPLGLADMMSRLLGIALTAVLVHDVGPQPSTILAWTADAHQPRWLVALALVAVSAAGVGLEILLRSWTRSRAQHIPLRVVLADELSSSGGLGLSVVTTGPLIALARPVIGPWSIPLCLGPLLLVQFAIRRQAGIRRTYRETIATLSRLTDVTGYTSPGHARRVALTSVELGRELGFTERDLTQLEYAALLHDLGQIALRVPIPGGATVLAAPSDQQRIADDGALIVRRTGVLDDVAHVLQRQTTPYRQVREFGEDLPLAARIIKVVNAYDDLTGGSELAAAQAVALERIHLGLGYEYDPAVVDALQRVLARRTSTP